MTRMAGNTQRSDAESLAGFQAEREESVHHVQGWIEGIIHLGRWQFHDPEGVAQEVMIKLLTIVRRGGYGGQSSFKTLSASGVGRKLTVISRETNQSRNLDGKARVSSSGM